MGLFFSCFSAGACFFLSFILFFQPYKQNIKANRWLSMYILVMGISFIGFYLQESVTDESKGYITEWINCFQFLLAPLIYISILFFVYPRMTFGGNKWFHFLPFLLFSPLELIFLLRYQGDQTISPIALFYCVSIFQKLLPFQFLIYILFSLRALLRHKRNLMLISSSIEEINLNWLKNFLIVLLFLTVFWFNNLFFESPVLKGIMPFVYAVSIFIVGFYAIKQKTIFQRSDEHTEGISEIIESDPENEPAKLKRLKDVELNELAVRLRVLLEEEKIFLDNELNLSKVASKLSCNVHDASYLINAVAGDNFYNYINKYRVEEAKKLLLSEKEIELNILGIAFESGFNSKTAFNTSFKKFTGLSPTQFIKSNTANSN